MALKGKYNIGKVVKTVSMGMRVTVIASQLLYYQPVKI